MKLPKIITFMVIFLWVSKTDLAAQEKEAIDIGVRLRVAAAPVSTSQIVGTLAALHGDTLFLQAGNSLSSTPLAIPRTAITRLEVSRGKSLRGKSVLAGSISGFLLGFLATFIVLEANAASLDLGDDSIFLGSVIGSAGGLVLGGLIGSRFPGERWENISVDCILVKISSPAMIQERKSKKDIVFIAGGTGIGNTKKESETRSGINTALRLGFNLNRSFALSLDYEINDRRDEKPLSTDFVKSGISFSVARKPKVLSTRYTFFSVQTNLRERFFIRSSAGLGFRRFVSYRQVYGAIDPNTQKPKIDRYEGSVFSGTAFAFGLSAGYELMRMRAFSFALEGTYRKSLGEDSSGTRRAVGVQGLVVLRF